MRETTSSSVALSGSGLVSSAAPSTADRQSIQHRMHGSLSQASMEADGWPHKRIPKHTSPSTTRKTNAKQRRNNGSRSCILVALSFVPLSHPRRKPRCGWRCASPNWVCGAPCATGSFRFEGCHPRSTFRRDAPVDKGVDAENWPSK